MDRRSALVLLVVVLLGLGLLVVIGVAVILPASSARTLPTALAMPPSDTPAPPTPIPPSATSSPTETITVSPTASPSLTATTADTATTPPQDTLAAETATPQDTAVAEAPTEATVTTDASSTPTGGSVDFIPDTETPLPTNPPPIQVTVVIQKTIAGTNTIPTAAPTSAAPTQGGPTSPVVAPPTVPPTISAAVGAPLQTIVDVSNGQMMVVSTAFPATDALTNMGVTPPAPPAGSSWLLVEALMKCTPSVNCTPPTGSLKVIGAAGQYDPTTAFVIDPKFGSEGFSSGQVWGYLEFAIPTGEQNLRLTYTVGSKIYVFALK